MTPDTRLSTKSPNARSKFEDKQVSASEEELELRDLVPLPQLEVRDEKKTQASKIIKWMVDPIYVSPEHKKPFREIAGLSQAMLERLQSLGYQDAFAVQTAVLPLALKDLESLGPDPLPDILVNAYTGSGKTLAYAVPIVEALTNRVVPRLRAVILLPTRPLMAQVRQVFEGLTKGTNLRVKSLRGDQTFADEQNSLIASVPDILIATPGRLVDHIRQTQQFSLEDLRYLVVDEADRLLNQSFQEWVDVVNGALKEPKPIAYEWYRPPQRFVFSATLTRDPGKLASLRIGPNPRIVVVGSKETDLEEMQQKDWEFHAPQGLQEVLVRIKDESHKPLGLLKAMIDHEIHERVLIFAKSNEAASRLPRLLELIGQDVLGVSLSFGRCTGEMDASQRKRVLRHFSQGKIDVLVCTDLIARGIDISTIKHVVNYDLPVGAREYVHRVGRTARAGATGTAWSLAVTAPEQKHFWAIARRIYRRQQVAVEEVDLSMVDMDAYEAALRQLEKEVFNM
jgi:ATP-dependent RNA helicase DDX51/DBP6